MNRPILPCAFALMSGIFIASGIRSLLPSCAILFVLVLGVYLLRQRIGKIMVLCISLCLFIGFFLHSYREAVTESSYQLLIGQPIVAEVLLERNPSAGVVQETCVARVLRLWANGQPIERPIQGFGRVQLRAKLGLTSYRCGDVLLVEGTVSLPRPQRNPGGYNEKQTILGEGMIGVLDAIKLQKVGHKRTPLRDAGYAIHAHTKAVLLEHLPEKEGYVLLGMLLGDIENLSEQEKELFRTSGLMHIMAVSGANVAFVVFPLLWLLARLGLNKRWSGLVVLPALLLFALATGLDPSVVRAAWMAACMLAGLAFFRKPDLACSMGATAILMLLHNSWSLFGAGFQLSFLAVSCLLLFEKKITATLPVKWPKAIRTSLGGTVAVQIGLAPLMANLFHTFSSWTIWANLLVLPLTGTLTMLGTAMSFLQLVLPSAWVKPIGFFARHIVDYVLWVAEAISRLPFAHVLVPAIPIAALVGYCVGILWMRFAAQIPGATKWHLQPLGALAIVLIAILSSSIPSNKLRILFLDVGQGDAIFVSYPRGKSLLIDAGGNAFGGREDTAGEKTVIPGILAMGHFYPDQVLVTHGHNDHIGGVPAVLEQMGGSLLVPPVQDENLTELVEQAETLFLPTNVVSAGIRLDAENAVRVTVLSPEPDCRSIEADENENSLVLELVYGEFHVLFMADAGRKTEARLLQEGKMQQVDVLKVGHHGSKYASTAPFAEAVKPQIAIISVGRNVFGHPSNDAISRLQMVGAGVHCTIDTGAVLLETDGDTYRLRNWGIVEPHWLSSCIERWITVYAKNLTGR